MTKVIWDTLYDAVPAEEHEDRHGAGVTRVGREAHADGDLHGPVYDDTGGDENNPEGNASDYVTAQEEEAVPDSDKVRIEVPKDVKHGDTIPTPDEAEVGNVRFLMPKISILARRGGGHNETRGCAHFILVAKAALLFPRSPC